jgi:hypothetical protein
MLLALPAPVPVPPVDLSGEGLVALRVGRAETVSDGVIEHAVILVGDGKILTIGQDLPIERGIPVIDLPDWTVMPGLVDPYSRLGLEGRAGTQFEPHRTPLAELYPRSFDYADALAEGVTTLALYPPGTGFPGQSVVVRTKGEDRQEMLLAENVYMKIYFRADARSKKQLRDGFKKLDDWIEKEQKAREKFEKDLEKAEKKRKDDEKKAKEAKEEYKPEPLPTYEPPELDEKIRPFKALRDGELKALVSISGAADYLHWLEALGEEDFAWDLRVPVTRQLNLYEIADKLGEKQARIVMEPELTLHPGTMRERNLPAELARAGARIVLLPRSDSVRSMKAWRTDVGLLLSSGLGREAALRAMTLEAAAVLGLEDQLGSLEVGKTANLLFLDGDPFEVATRVQAVMLEGEFVHGEVNQ